MQVKTRVKAEGVKMNPTEPLVRAQSQTKGLKVKSHIKAGYYYSYTYGGSYYAYHY